MSDAMLADLLAATILVALIGYALLGGADYGGGVWDMFATGPRKEAQRTLIADAIGPVWEANHVWLILVVVLLFTAFPPAFAMLTTVLHIPLALMLVGIVARGSAFTFRTYDDRRDSAQRRWGRPFAIASIITPFLLGLCIGALATGDVGEAGALVDAVRRCGEAAGEACREARAAATFGAVYVDPWISPFAVGVGMLALALFAFLAATYLTVEAPDDALKEDFRARALWSGGAVSLIAIALLWYGARHEVELVREGMLGARWAIPFHIVTGLAAAAAMLALRARRWQLARVAAAGVVTLVLGGWGVAQYPALVPPQVTVQTAAAPAATMRLVLITLAVGAVILIPSLGYLFRVFKGKRTAFEPSPGDES